MLPAKDVQALLKMGCEISVDSKFYMPDALFEMASAARSPSLLILRDCGSFGIAVLSRIAGAGSVRLEF